MKPGLRTLLLFTIAALVLAGLPAAAADDLDDDLQSVSSRIKQLNGRIGAAAADRSTLARELLATGDRMDGALDAVAQVRADLGALEIDLGRQRVMLAAVREDLERRYRILAETRDELDTARAAAFQSARDTYMGSGFAMPQIAFSSTAVSDVALGLEYLDRATAENEATVSRFIVLVDEEERASERVADQERTVADHVARLADEEAQLLDLRAVLQQRSDDLQAEYDVQKRLLARVEAEISDFENELAGLEREEASIRALIVERSAPPVTSAAPLKSGIFFRPVPGAVTSGFGPRVHPIYGTVKMHSGVDMNGSSGQPIVSAEDGTVIFAGSKGGYGTTVMIDHGGGIVTLYAHQSKLAVSAGQRVSAGERIGYVGSTGLSTGPHLHFEVRKGGAPVDPLGYI